jgi:hypothetical protein
MRLSSGLARNAFGLAVLTLVFAGLAAALLAPLTLAPAEQVYDARSFRYAFFNQPDVELNGWILGWVAHALSRGDLSGLFDANAFYPNPSSLALSEHLLGVQPLFAPLYLATGDVALAHNLWLVSTFVLCGVAMYAVALRWLGTHRAAAVAGLAWAFAPWRFYEMAHVQTLSVQYLPPIVWLVWESAERRSAARWTALGLLVLVQIFSSYYLAYAAFVAVGVFAVGAVLRSCTPLRTIAWLASAAGIPALLLVPVTLPYLELRDLATYGVRFELGWGALHEFLFPAAPEGVGGTWGAWRALPWLAAVGLALGLRRSGTRGLTLVLGALAALAALLAVGGRLAVGGMRVFDLDPLLAALVPGWTALRVLNRFGLLAWLAVSALAALPFGRAPEPAERPARAAQRVLAGALLFALVFSTASVGLRTRPAPPQLVPDEPYRWLAAHGDGDPVLEWPAGFAEDEVRYMFMSTRHWLPLVNGYSGYLPPSTALLHELARSLPERGAFRSFTQLNVARWLVVHTGNLREGGRDWRALEASGAELRLQEESLLVYELPYDPTRPPAFPLAGSRDASFFATPKSALRERDLEATLQPLRRRVHDRSFLGAAVPLRVRNDSGSPWPSVGFPEDGLVGVEFRAEPRDADGALLPLDGFTRLPVDLRPGEEAVVWARVLAPGGPGTWRIVPCLSQRRTAAMRCSREASFTLVVHAAAASGGDARRGAE